MPTLSTRPPFKHHTFYISIVVNDFQSTFQKYSSERFLGATCDTGAKRTVVAISQAQEYCREYKIPFRFTASNSVLSLDTVFVAVLN